MNKEGDTFKEVVLKVSGSIRVIRILRRTSESISVFLTMDRDQEALKAVQVYK